MKAKFVLLFFLIVITAQLNLIPDTNTAIFIQNPSFSLNSEFNLKFSFPRGKKEEIETDSLDSPGLNHKQFFGIKFPSELGEELKFNQWDTPKFDCNLSDDTRSYLVTAVTSAISKVTSTVEVEKSIAYCQLDEDPSNLPLKIGPDKIYTLTIKLNKKISTKFINLISLFTSTSNHPEKIIIDYLPVIGNVVLYDNWLNWKLTKPLDVISTKFLVPNGVASNDTGYKLFPYVNFTLKIELKSNDFISFSDYMLIINYPAQAVAPGNSVISTAVNDTNDNQKSLKGSLILKRIDTNSLLVDGIEEILKPSRQFYLEMSGWKALDSDIGIQRPLEIILYYKNTFSIYSYSQVNVIYVERSVLTVTANHPEYWDIFRNGAWPTRFSFQSINRLDNSDGYFVMIQHDNALLATANDGNIITFIASTCDFSENSNFNNIIGVRPSCFPLRLDQNYPDENTIQEFSGSGIFFYLKGPIEANQIFSLNVWIYADNCAGYNFNNFSGNAFSIPRFKVSIYNKMNPNEINEMRFDLTNPNIQKIAEGSQLYDGKCWNNKIADFEPNDVGSSILDNRFKININNDNDMKSEKKKFTIKFVEIFDWKVGNQSQEACTNCFDNDISTGTFSEKFLYSATNNISDGSYFLAAADMKSNGMPLLSVLPSSLMFTKDSDDSAPININGKLTVLFSKAWFIGTDNYKFSSSTPCYLSWACSSGVENIKKLSKKINSDYPSPGKNYIAAKRGTSSTQGEFDEIDTTLTFADTSKNTKSNIMKIVSEFYSKGGNNNNWAFIEDINTTNEFTFAWFTNCIKWKTNGISSIKSLYTYIDIQYRWSYAESSSAMLRTVSNFRLIKLFPEGGVFHDFSKFSANANTENPYINHFVMAKNSDYSPVCLIEIKGSAIQNVSTNDSNAFILWIGLGSILETDYIDASSTYPVSPLVSTAGVYGLQSQNPFHHENLYVSDDYILSDPNNYEYPPLFRLLASLEDKYTLWNNQTGQRSVRGPNKSIYHFLMGSVLIFNGLNNGNLQGTTNLPLYIPYYCNYAKINSNKENRIFLNFPPTIFGAWTSISSFDSVNAFKSYLNYKSPDSADSFAVIINYVKNDVPNIKRGLFKNQSTPNLPIYSNHYTATLLWNAFTNSDDGLYVYNANRNNKNNKVMTCTGFSIFLSSKIELAKTISINTNPPRNLSYFQYEKSTSKFYVMGKSFSKAVFVGELTTLGDAPLNNINNPNVLDGSPAIKILGIKRPTIISFVENGDLTVSNKVAFSCVSAHQSHLDALTNYFYTSLSGTNFVLDWSYSNSNWPDGGISWDKESEIFKQDYGGNIIISMTSPDILPAYSKINFSAGSTFNSNTICGIVTGPSMFAKDCKNTVGVFSCEVPDTGNSFKVCCYNIFIGDSIIMNKLSAKFTTEPDNPSIKDYVLEEVYLAVSQLQSINNRFQIPTNNSQKEDMIGTKYAVIKEVKYSHVDSEGGIGKVTIAIELPREPTRDMRISIIGDMNGLLIPGVGNDPRCVASLGKDTRYGSEWDSGNILIDSCSTNHISKGTPVIITTKRMIYKCGMKFSKNLYITLWPINVVNWNTSTKNNFLVTMQLNSLDPLAKNSQTVSIPLPVTVSKKPNFIGQWDSLCKVTSVFPRIPSEKADYTFEFDLDTRKVELIGTTPNEISIFWPYQYYGSTITKTICYYYNTILDCSFEDEGIFNIRFRQPLPIGSGNKIVVVVGGIPNPEINFDYSFPCTINFTNFSSGERLNIITGSGKLIGGITSEYILQRGGLRILNPPSPISNQNPKYTSIHTFRITFDNAYGLTSLPISISYPILYIIFPNEYNLSWYINKPGAIINEFTVDTKYTQISKTKTFSPYKIDLSGNKIILYFNEPSLTFNIYWKYWDIILTNIVNPINSTIFEGIEKTFGTGSYTITLTNEDENVYYTTFSNSNSFSSQLIPTSIESNIMWSRGNIFNHDFNKWVVDIYSNPLYPNKLNVRAGRFNQAFMEVKIPINIKINLSSTEIYLSDKIFHTAEDSYNISPSYFSEIEFLIGCSCNTPEGRYLVNFTSSNTSAFDPLSPILVIVTQSTKAIIAFQSSPPPVPIAGSNWLEIYLSEPNFDPINIVWKKAETVYNDETAKLTNVKIEPTKYFDFSNNSPQLMARSQFSINTPKEVSFPQRFYNSDPNECFTFNGSSSIQYTISGQSANFPPQVDLEYYLKYTNSDYDSTLSKNSVKIRFTPLVSPVYLYCALVCFDHDFPSDKDIISPKNEDSFYLQFYSKQLITSNPIDFTFNNLIRAQRYKLRCLVETTKGDVQQRSVLSTSVDNPRLIPTTLVDRAKIIPTPPVATKCAQWNFTVDPGINTRYALINYCQKLFSSLGWFDNGCIICTDADLSIIAPGLDINNGRTCSGNSVNPSSNQSANSKKQNNNSFTVCPVPHPVCATDFPGSYTDTFNGFVNSLMTSKQFLDLLNVSNVQLSITNSVLKITDDIKPEINKLIVNIVSYTKDGNFTLTATFPTPVSCYWKIAVSTGSSTLPSFNLIKSCSDICWCGNSKIGPILTQITNYDFNIRNFLINTKYNVYFACNNYLPFPEKDSDVNLIGSFTITDTSSTAKVNLKTNEDRIMLGGRNLEMNLVGLVFIFILLLF